ncbi:MAG: UDP-2,3-diacylglucosamine diphosphatase LpxI [bacterium]|nr:UDP-2,3-diacylglucosamine diphosphatase LpxI [bacterium]
MNKVGLIAGGGGIPLLLAREIKKKEECLIVIDVTKDNRFEGEIDPVYHLGLGRINEIIQTLHREKVERIIMIGKVDKGILFAQPDLDERTYFLLKKLPNRNDTSIMQAIVNELEGEGINVLDQTKYLSEWQPSKGVLTKKEPNPSQERDIEYGLSMARKIAELDIGQTVVVKEQTILAVEAIEGTDAAIQRGGKLGGDGVVVVKVSRPYHDVRFDVPAVGVDTITTMREVKAAVLAVEARMTLMVERDRVLEEANNDGIIIVAV